MLISSVYLWSNTCKPSHKYSLNHLPQALLILLASIKSVWANCQIISFKIHTYPAIVYNSSSFDCNSSRMVLKIYLLYLFVSSENIIIESLAMTSYLNFFRPFSQFTSIWFGIFDFSLFIEVMRRDKNDILLCHYKVYFSLQNYSNFQ